MADQRARQAMAEATPTSNERDARGNWRPAAAIQPLPIFAWPPPCTVRPAPRSRPDLWPAFCGRYESAEGNAYRVSQVDDGLILENLSNGQTTPITLHGADYGVSGYQTIRFLRGQREPMTAPWALALDLRILPRCGDMSTTD